MNTAQGSTSTHVIHVLLSPGMERASYQNRSLCGEPPGEPKTWPAGHLCVRLQPGRVLPPVVNCPACIQAFQDRFR